MTFPSGAAWTAFGGEPRQKRWIASSIRNLISMRPCRMLLTSARMFFLVIRPRGQLFTYTHQSNNTGDRNRSVFSDNLSEGGRGSLDFDFRVGPSSVQERSPAGGWGERSATSTSVHERTSLSLSLYDVPVADCQCFHFGILLTWNRTYQPTPSGLFQLPFSRM